MAKTLHDHVVVEQTEPDVFVSKFLPERVGVAMPVAYGGCTMGSAVYAACLTVTDRFHLYSAMGHYLGPGSLDEKLTCTVERVRDTKSFATRRVRVTQPTADGKLRIRLELLADFYVPEASELIYSVPPVGNHPPPDDLPTDKEHCAALVARGDITEKELSIHRKRAALMEALYDIRHCPDSMTGQNLYGLLKPRTTQDHLPIGLRTSTEYFKARDPLPSQTAQMAALAFCMDSGISTLPLMHGDTRLEDVVAIASLDFALRIMQPRIDLHEWHLSQRSTSCSAGGITFGEARMWDGKGNMVASMTQQSIFRVKGRPKALL